VRSGDSFADLGPWSDRREGHDLTELDQSEFWNGAGGDAWVEMQPVLDTMFAPLAEMLAETAAERGARRVLDVGCGAGATTIAVSGRLGEGATCTGVDISAGLIEAAQARAVGLNPAPRFLLADAAEHPFAEGEFGLLVSRFGVMFFADPGAAFARLRQAVEAGGGLRFFVWRAPEENPFMTVGAQAAAHLLPEMPPRQPGAPGPFAFAEEGSVSKALAAGGWDAIEVEPVDIPCAFPEADLLRYLARIGPIGQALRDADERTRAAVLDAVRPAYEPFVHGDEVRFTACCWSVGARNS
jgi:SAM-dependent methyltransferase